MKNSKPSVGVQNKASANPKNAEKPKNIKAVFGTPKKQSK